MRIAIIENGTIINITDSTLEHVLACGFCCEETETGNIGQVKVAGVWVYSIDSVDINQS